MVFQGLTEQIDDLPAEFGQLIQKENASMSQGDDPRLGNGPAAHQGLPGDGMMGRQKRPFCDQGPAWRQPAGHAVDGSDLHAFLLGQRRQDAGHPSGKHAFARTGRSAEQGVMKAGGCDLQDPLGSFLPMDIGEINVDFLLPLSEEGFQIHMAGRQQAVPSSLGC